MVCVSGFLVPPGYSLGNLTDTNTCTVNFKVQLCLVRPRQPWVQHDYKVHIKLHQFLCILLWRKKWRGKAPLRTQRQAQPRERRPGTFTPPCHHIPMLLNVETSPLVQGVTKPESSLCWENILNDHQHIFPTSGTLMNTCMTTQGCLQAPTSTACTAVHYCCSCSRSGVAASQEPNGYRN